MNPDHSKLRQQQQSEQASEQRLNQGNEAAHDFESVEEMIRFDAKDHAPPAAVTERLKESIAREPAPPRSWWRRLFGLT
ncbi:MAG: hypothetical protein U1G07_04025 [Verrucomicrobiota bacterium]